MTPLFLSAFLQNTGLTLVLVGIIFYLIQRFHATLFELGALSALGAFVFMVGALFNRKLSRRFSPKAVALFGAGLFLLATLSFPVLPSLASFFWVYPFASLALALFWPSLENWILLESEPRLLKRNVGRFNLSWSPGQILAPFLAGVLFEKGMTLPIWGGVLFVLPVLFILGRAPLRDPQRRDSPDKTIPPQGIPSSPLLVSCWLANFSGWFCAAIFRSLFPKYGWGLGLSPTTIGGFLLLIGAGQVLFFFLLGRREGWERGGRFLLFWEGVACVSVLCIAWLYHPLLWAAAFFLFGCFAGTAYSASILVSLTEKGVHGGGSGFHEALVGLGICLGPLVGGGVGSLFGARAPYIVSALVLGMVLLVQGILFRSSRNRAT